MSEIDVLNKILERLEAMEKSNNQRFDRLENQVNDIRNDTKELKSEVTKINIKIENSLEPNIKLIAEGQQPLSQIAEDVEHIKEEQEEIKNNVAALMIIVPEYGAKIEEKGLIPSERKRTSFCWFFLYFLQSVGSLSRRNPLRTGWRIPPLFVLCMYSTTQTSFGSVQTASSFPWPAGTGPSNGGLWSFGRFLISRKDSPPTPRVTCPLYASLSFRYCPSTMLIMCFSL